MEHACRMLLSKKSRRRIVAFLIFLLFIEATFSYSAITADENAQEQLSGILSFGISERADKTPDLKTRPAEGESLPKFDAPGGPESGAVGIDKRIIDFDASTGIATVQLDIEGKPKFSDANPIYIALIYDLSYSMIIASNNVNGQSRLAYAKEAGKAFSEIFLGEDGKAMGNKIAIGGFATVAHTSAGWSDDLSTVKNRITNLTVNQTNNFNTNASSGIREAERLLNDIPNANPNAHKIVILLGDGAQTASYSPLQTSAENSYLKGTWTKNLTENGLSRTVYTQFDVSQASKELFTRGAEGHYGFNYNYILEIQTLSTTDLVYKTAERFSEASISEAGRVKDAIPGITFYTIGLALAPANSTLAFDYESAFARYTLSNIASTPGHFFEVTPIAIANLSNLYKALAASIIGAGSDAEVTDILGDGVSLVGIPTSDYPSTALKPIETDGDKIIWRLGTIPSGSPATLTYQVKINDSQLGKLPVNKSAVLTYSPAGEFDKATQIFPMPYLYRSTVEIEKAFNGDIDGFSENLLNFNIHHTSNNGEAQKSSGQLYNPKTGILSKLYNLYACEPLNPNDELKPYALNISEHLTLEMQKNGIFLESITTDGNASKPGQALSANLQVAFTESGESHKVIFTNSASDLVKGEKIVKVQRTAPAAFDGRQFTFEILDSKGNIVSRASTAPFENLIPVGEEELPNQDLKYDYYLLPFEFEPIPQNYWGESALLLREVEPQDNAESSESQGIWVYDKTALYLTIDEKGALYIFSDEEQTNSADAAFVNAFVSDADEEPSSPGEDPEDPGETPEDPGKEPENPDVPKGPDEEPPNPNQEISVSIKKTFSLISDSESSFISSLDGIGDNDLYNFTFNVYDMDSYNPHSLSNDVLASASLSPLLGSDLKNMLSASALSVEGSFEAKTDPISLTVNLDGIKETLEDSDVYPKRFLVAEWLEVIDGTSNMPINDQSDNRVAMWNVKNASGSLFFLNQATFFASRSGNIVDAAGGSSENEIIMDNPIGSLVSRVIYLTKIAKEEDFTPINGLFKFAITENGSPIEVNVLDYEDAWHPESPYPIWIETGDLGVKTVAIQLPATDAGYSHIYRIEEEPPQEREGLDETWSTSAKLEAFEEISGSSINFAVVKDISCNTIVAFMNSPSANMPDEPEGPVEGIAGIKVTKKASSSVITPGGTIDYTVEIENTGEIDLINLNITDSSFSKAGVSAENARLTEDGTELPFSISGKSLIIEDPDYVFKKGAIILLTYTLVFDGSWTAGDALNNVAAATGFYDDGSASDEDVAEAIAPPEEEQITQTPEPADNSEIINESEVPGGSVDVENPSESPEVSSESPTNSPSQPQPPVNQPVPTGDESLDVEENTPPEGALNIDTPNPPEAQPPAPEEPGGLTDIDEGGIPEGALEIDDSTTPEYNPADVDPDGFLDIDEGDIPEGALEIDDSNTPESNQTEEEPDGFLDIDEDNVPEGAIDSGADENQNVNPDTGDKSGRNFVSLYMILLLAALQLGLIKFILNTHKASENDDGGKKE
ncbi:MAG: VWA domain-containing protein [Clostridiales bacterium]|nr:VWA domain-containing protein [Clostridiales bacterium]